MYRHGVDTTYNNKHLVTLAPLAPLRAEHTFIRRYLLAIIACSLLAIGSPLIFAVGQHFSTRYTYSGVVPHRKAPTVAGLNMSLNHADAAVTLSRITGQVITFEIAGSKVQVPSAIIESWLKTSKTNGSVALHVDEAAISASLPVLAKNSLREATPTIATTHADGSTYTITAGKDGLALAATDDVVHTLALNLLAGDGAQLKLPTKTVKSPIVSPSYFYKLIEVDLSNKQMYLYDKGQLTRSYAVSAGAPATPTVVGQFKIYAKYTVQDMSGYNPDGTPYVQPHVRWINYFYKDYAVHGNYWRPLSYFGNINSSHGCVSVPEDQAKWIYDWAPIGTTVISYR